MWDGSGSRDASRRSKQSHDQHTHKSTIGGGHSQSQSVRRQDGIGYRGGYAPNQAPETTRGEPAGEARAALCLARHTPKALRTGPRQRAMSTPRSREEDLVKSGKQLDPESKGAPIGGGHGRTRPGQTPYVGWSERVPRATTSPPRRPPCLSALGRSVAGVAPVAGFWGGVPLSFLLAVVSCELRKQKAPICRPFCRSAPMTFRPRGAVFSPVSVPFVVWASLL